jgi:hypothetical protein
VPIPGKRRVERKARVDFRRLRAGAERISLIESILTKQRKEKPVMLGVKFALQEWNGNLPSASLG